MDQPLTVVNLTPGSIIQINFSPIERMRTIAAVDESGTSCSVLIEKNGSAKHFPIVDSMQPEEMGTVSEWVSTRVAEEDSEAYISMWKSIGERTNVDYLSKVRALNWAIINTHFDAEAALEEASAELKKIYEGLAMISKVASLASPKK
ncbi:hypothetical protein R6242_19530 [Iodobacter sp. CM08]|uniref:hypothetical protein n=1 Tax=Iodobacter sp. CM08 TaxID=3085902 RepID=UPI002981205C|nr:hypothetical protein [Iodobacter sp. CM08]MDW5418764.1 hypothetical protein [Iodobacter sp. CM08]